jgi:hypothetical protein
MKKLLFTTLILFGLSVPVNASMIIIDYQGETFVHSTIVERGLLINSDDDDIYDIAIKPLENGLTKLDGSVTIPLSNLYINNTREDVYLRYNEYSNLFHGLTMGGVARSLTAKIRDYGVVPAGTYSINFEIQGTNVEDGSIITSTFNLQFIVPTIQEINIADNNSRIVVGSEDAFSKNKKILNENSSMIYITSNCNWELVANSDNFGDRVAEYYIRTIAASPNVQERLLDRVILKDGQEIVLARGKAPANNEFVTIEYALENTDNSAIKSGNYENRIRYILREVR